MICFVGQRNMAVHFCKLRSFIKKPKNINQGKWGFLEVTPLFY